MVKTWNSGAKKAAAATPAAVAAAKEKEKNEPKPFQLVFPKNFDDQLIMRVDVDLRVVLTWYPSSRRIPCYPLTSPISCASPI